MLASSLTADSHATLSAMLQYKQISKTPNFKEGKQLLAEQNKDKTKQRKHVTHCDKQIGKPNFKEGKQLLANKNNKDKNKDVKSNDKPTCTT